jgi:hypothetical protein
VTLPRTGWSDQQDATVGVHEARAGELDHLQLGDLGMEAPVEVRGRLHGGDTRLLQASDEKPIRPARQFIFDEELEEVERRERGGFCLRDARRQRVDHPREPERPQAGGELDRHVRKWSRGIGPSSGWRDRWW